MIDNNKDVANTLEELKIMHADYGYDGLLPDEDSYEDSLYGLDALQKGKAEMNRFDLEAQIMKCWQVVDSLDTITEGVLEYDWTPDQVSNATIGLKEIYQLEFEKLQGMFELLVHNGDIK